MDTLHGVDSKLIMKDIKDILAVFKRYNTHLFLSYGAVLGSVRDKDFIKWDDDVDFDVIQPIDYETRKAIGWALIDLGFRPQPIAFNVFGRMEPGEIGYNGDGETGIIVCERNFKFSIFFYKEEPTENNDGDVVYEMVCTPKIGAVKLISCLSKFYQKPDTVKLHGVKFTTPGPIKEYLEYVYGKDWKKPIKDYHAPQYKQRHE